MDRPDGKCVTDNIATSIWDQMTATEVHISTPWCTLHQVHMLNLCSASGVTLRIVDVCCRIGTRLVFNCVCLWNLGITSSVTCRSVDVCAGIVGMRLIIYCIHMWNLGSASGVTR